MVATSTNLFDLDWFRYRFLVAKLFNSFLVFWQLHQSRRQGLLKLSLATFPVLSTPPSKELLILSQGQCVVASSANLLDPQVTQRLNLFWLFNVFQMAMPALSFIVRCSSTTPREYSPFRIQSNRMEVSTVHLHYPCLFLNQSLHNRRLAAARCLFVQTSTPGIDPAFFAQGQGVVVSASNLSDCGFQRDSHKLVQIRRATQFGKAQFAMQR